MYVCMYACMHVCMYACMYMYVYVFVYVYVYVYAYVYIYICVCVGVCVCVLSSLASPSQTLRLQPPFGPSAPFAPRSRSRRFFLPPNSQSLSGALYIHIYYSSIFFCDWLD